LTKTLRLAEATDLKVGDKLEVVAVGKPGIAGTLLTVRLVK